MIRIRIRRNTKNEVISYQITGHSGTAPIGEDIVCAAVSVLAQTTILGFSHILKQKPEYSIHDGSLHFQVGDGLSASERKEASLLLETMVVGLKNIKEQYPTVIAIEEEEVQQ